MAEKIHVVVRADLPPGAQAVQGMHSFRQFAERHRERERRWFEESNHIAFLEVADEAALVRLSREAGVRGYRLSEFREPDLGGSLTSVTIAPEGRPVCRRLRKALSQGAVPSGDGVRVHDREDLVDGGPGGGLPAGA